MLKIWTVFAAITEQTHPISEELSDCDKIKELMNNINISSELQKVLKNNMQMGKLLSGIEWLSSTFDYLLLYTILLQLKLFEIELYTELPTDLTYLTSDYLKTDEYDGLTPEFDGWLSLEDLKEKIREFEILYRIETAILNNEESKQKLDELIKKSKKWIGGDVSFVKLVHLYHKDEDTVITSQDWPEKYKEFTSLIKNNVKDWKDTYAYFKMYKIPLPYDHELDVIERFTRK